MLRNEVMRGHCWQHFVAPVLAALFLSFCRGATIVDELYQKIPHLPQVATSLPSMTHRLPMHGLAKFRCGVFCEALVDCTIFCLSSTDCLGFSAPTLFISGHDWTSIPAAAGTFDVCYIKQAAFLIDVKVLPLTGTEPDYAENNITNSVDGKCTLGGTYYHSALATNPWWQVQFPSPQLISRVIVAMDYGHLHYNVTAVQVRVNDAVGSGTFSGQLMTKVSGTVEAGQQLVYEPAQPTMGLTVSIQSIGTSVYLTLCDVFFE